MLNLSKPIAKLTTEFWQLFVEGASMRCFFVSLLLAACLCQSASANFTAEFDSSIPGMYGVNTQIDLSGGGAATTDGNTSQVDYANVGRFYLSVMSFTPVSGSASFTNSTTNQTVGVSHVFLSDAGNGTISFVLSSPLSYTIGDMLTSTSSDWQISAPMESFTGLGPLPQSSLNNPSMIGLPALDIRLGDSFEVTVPEPSSLHAAATVAIAGILWRRRRRR